MGNACSVLVVGSGGRSLDRSYRTPSFMLEIMRLNKVLWFPCRAHRLRVTRQDILCISITRKAQLLKLRRE